MEFRYRIKEDTQKVTIIGVKDCPSNLTIPSTIVHTDKKEYIVDSVCFGNPGKGRNDDAGLVCELISFPSTISSIRIVKNTTIKEMRLPDNLVEIKSLAFMDCERLERVVFPCSLEIIKGGAFLRCKSLKEAIIPDSVKEIGLYAFQDCVQLSRVQIRKNQYFHPTAFIGCSSLKDFGNEFIIEDGFLYNREKTEIYTWLGIQEQPLVDFIAPDTVKILDNGLRSCNGIRSIDLSRTKITEIYSDTFNVCQDLQEVILPNGIKKIGEQAFWGCGKLSEILIPKSVTSIASSAFAKCSNLKSIKVDSNSSNYEAKDGILFDKRAETLICYPGGKETISIPEGVTSIGDWAFSGCSNLTSINIPSTIASIGDYAFAFCSALTTITIPNSVKVIGRGAFDACPSIKSVRIPIGYKKDIHIIFTNHKDININYLQPRNTQHYYPPKTGAYTHGRLRPCPYCGSNNVEIYSDGTAQCESCRGEYTYWR